MSSKHSPLASSGSGRAGNSPLRHRAAKVTECRGISGQTVRNGDRSRVSLNAKAKRRSNPSRRHGGVWPERFRMAVWPWRRLDGPSSARGARKRPELRSDYARLHSRLDDRASLITSARQAMRTTQDAPSRARASTRARSRSAPLPLEDDEPARLAHRGARLGSEQDVEIGVGRGCLQLSGPIRGHLELTDIQDIPSRTRAYPDHVGRERWIQVGGRRQVLHFQRHKRVLVVVDASGDCADGARRKEP